MPSHPKKKNTLFLFDRPTQRDPIHVDDVLGLGAGIEKILGLQAPSIVESPGRAVELLVPDC